MTERPTVVRSINDETATRCVDVYRNADGSFGYGEFRRDPEDPRGWTRLGGLMSGKFGSPEEALTASRAAVPWLAGAVSDQQQALDIAGQFRGCNVGNSERRRHSGARRIREPGPVRAERRPGNCG